MQPLESTPPTPTPTRVLVADQNSAVRASLRYFVESEPGFEFVGDVSDTEWLRWALRVTAPDVVVVDCTLPGGGLQEIVECARRRLPGARIVVLGCGPWQAPTAADAGADAYVSKCESPDVLRAALHRLAERRN
jgi:DNA-binding NarL/FixJ family response regulator